MKLYLIRHAESANNAIFSDSAADEGRTPDPEITDTGHRQAELLAAHLADPRAEPLHHPHASQDAQQSFGLTHLYCSLMTRSILTGRYIAESCQLPLVAHADLFEKGGIYELDLDARAVGLPGPGRSYFSQRFPGLELPMDLSEGGWYDRPAETEERFVERVQRVVRDIGQRHAHTDDVVAMVVHGDFIDQLVNELIGIERRAENYRIHWVANWAFHNTSITRIDLLTGSRVVVYTNRVAHLPRDLVTW